MTASSRRRLPLHPFEVVTYGVTLAFVLFLRLRGVPLGWRAVDYMVDALLPRLPGVLALGFALHLLAHLARRRSPRAWLRAVAAPVELLLLARLWLAAMTMTFAYTWLKVSVPLLTRTLHDPALWQLDRLIHLGVSPTIFAIELFGRGAAARGLDLWYALWITSVLAVQSVIFLSRESVLRRNFALACVLLWLAGAVVYAAIPAVGPVFFQPELFTEVAPRLPHTSRMGGELWRHYTSLVASRESGSAHTLIPFFAVAAMPSLHVGAHALFALWARRHARRWFAPFAVATALTFAGSLLSGWHYALDGYVGILLAWGAVVLADRLEPAPPPPEPPATSSVAGPESR